ncbi:hypothetical protein [Streptomyces sp. NPDC091682]|uniref:hypothetical protein n=1 Tax=unclassified Streptomyces TaxID=2593676 RepID=UPI00380E073F
MNRLPADPTVLHPFPEQPRVVLLKPLLTSPLDDVPDYAVVGGNPARLIRTRHSDDDIARLLSIAWWDWPAAHLTEHVRTVMSGSVDDLERAAPRA